MPKPWKLDMATAERVARAADALAWDAMTPEQRQKLIDAVNDQAKIGAYLSNPGMRPGGRKR
jgi:hypothetical protein